MERMLTIDWGAVVVADVSAAVFQLSDSLGGMPKYVALREAVMSKLLGCVRALMMESPNGPWHKLTESLNGPWYKLTWPVVLAYLQDPRLDVDCEDTVVCVTSTWMQHNALDVDKPLYKQVVNDLMSKILRVAHVSPHMLGSLVKSKLLESEKASAIHHVTATEDANHRGALIKYYEKVCPALWFEARTPPSHADAITQDFGMKVRVKDLEAQSVLLPTPWSFKSLPLYYKGWSFQIRLFFCGDSPSSFNATLAITYHATSWYIVPNQTPFPITISFVRPPTYPTLTSVGRAVTKQLVLDSSGKVDGSMTLILSRPAPAPIATNYFWRHFVTDDLEHLLFTISVK
jgi:hypothetical protein